MACKALQLDGHIDGEFPIDPAGTDHVAGQPAAHGAGGIVLSVSRATCIGVFKNDMVDEVGVGPTAGDTVAAGFANAAVVKGINTLELSAGKLKTGAAQTPFAFPPTNSPWAKGQHIFVSGTGFWDNAPANAGEGPFGIVNKPALTATDTLEVEMMAMAPFTSTVAT